jgi:hypothetical protein
MIDGYQRLNDPWPPTQSPSITYVSQVHFQSVLCFQHSASYKCVAPFDGKVYHGNYMFLNLYHTFIMCSNTSHYKSLCGNFVSNRIQYRNILNTTDCEECSKTIYCSRLQTLGELHKIFCNQQTNNAEYSSSLHKFFKYNKSHMFKDRFLCGLGEH